MDYKAIELVRTLAQCKAFDLGYFNEAEREASFRGDTIDLRDEPRLDQYDHESTSEVIEELCDELDEKRVSSKVAQLEGEVDNLKYRLDQQMRINKRLLAAQKDLPSFGTWRDTYGAGIRFPLRPCGEWGTVDADGKSVGIGFSSGGIYHRELRAFVLAACNAYISQSGIDDLRVENGKLRGIIERMKTAIQTVAKQIGEIP